MVEALARIDAAAGAHRCSPPQPLPEGWQWSRSAAPAFERPPAYEAVPGCRPPAPEATTTAACKAGDSAGQAPARPPRAVHGAASAASLAWSAPSSRSCSPAQACCSSSSRAPIIEEALKPAGIYLLLVKWPQALRGQLHTALLCAISGAVFGVIESLIYVELYYPEGNDSFVLFRFTVTPIMHALASFIVGFGLTRGLIDWANGKSSLPKMTRNCFIAGIGLHAVYNTTAVLSGAPGRAGLPREVARHCRHNSDRSWFLLPAGRGCPTGR